MKLDEVLREEWSVSITGTKDLGGGTIEIFVNPTKKEMEEISLKLRGSKYLRFIAKLKGKKLYVFSPKEYHSRVSEKIKGAGSEIDFWGVAKKEETNWILDSSDTRRKINLYDFKWFEKWIKTTNGKLKTSSYVNPVDFKNRISLKEEVLLEYIRKQGKKYFIYSHKTSKRIGRKDGYSSKTGAVAALLGMKSRGGFYNKSPKMQRQMIRKYKERHDSK